MTHLIARQSPIRIASTHARPIVAVEESPTETAAFHVPVDTTDGKRALDFSANRLFSELVNYFIR